MDAEGPEGPLAAGPASAESVASRAVTGELQGLLPAGIAERAAASESSIKKDEDQDGLGVQMGVRHLFQGAVGDWRRRFRHQITSDYLDGCRSQTLSAGLFTFFGVLATTISLGNRIQQTSGGQTGFLEYMLMNSAAGVIYATIEAQPYVVVQPTGPVTMLLEMLCEHAAEMHFEFLPFVAATGLFVGMWLILASACNVSGMIHYMSRFTGEVFAVFIGTAYMKDGIDGLVARFGERRTGPTRQALLGNDTNTGDALMSLNIGLLVLGLAYWLAKGLHGPRLCPTPFRQFLSAYSLTSAHRPLAALHTPTKCLDYFTPPLARTRRLLTDAPRLLRVYSLDRRRHASLPFCCWPPLHHHVPCRARPAWRHFADVTHTQCAPLPHHTRTPNSHSRQDTRTKHAQSDAPLTLCCSRCSFAQSSPTVTASTCFVRTTRRTTPTARPSPGAATPARPPTHGRLGWTWRTRVAATHSMKHGGWACRIWPPNGTSTCGGSCTRSRLSSSFSSTSSSPQALHSPRSYVCSRGATTTRASSSSASSTLSAHSSGCHLSPARSPSRRSSPSRWRRLLPRAARDSRRS